MDSIWEHKKKKVENISFIWNHSISFKRNGFVLDRWRNKEWEAMCDSRFGWE